MPWFRLEDGFLRHPKVVRIGPEATVLYIAGLAYCTEYLTDGMIPHEALPTLCAAKNPRRLAGLLVAVELWHELEDFYEVHDYLEYQPSRAETERMAETRSEKASRAARARWDATSNARSNARAPDQPMLGAMLGDATSTSTESRDPSDLSSEIAAKEKRKRPANPYFDALVTVFGDVTTRSAAAMYGSAASELKAAPDGTPEEILRRGNLLLQKDWKDCTPMALVKHWDALGREPARGSHFGKHILEP